MLANIEVKEQNIKSAKLEQEQEQEQEQVEEEPEEECQEMDKEEQPKNQDNNKLYENDTKSLFKSFPFWIFVIIVVAVVFIIILIILFILIIIVLVNNFKTKNLSEQVHKISFAQDKKGYNDDLLGGKIN